MKNRHFTTLGIGTELGIIIACKLCIGGKRPWLGSSYLLFNWQLNQHLWPSGWAFSNGAACSSCLFFFPSCLCLLLFMCFFFLGDIRSQQYKPKICVCCQTVLRVEAASVFFFFFCKGVVWHKPIAASVLLTCILVFNSFYFLNFLCSYFEIFMFILVYKFF